MTNRLTTTMDKLAGMAKQKAGELLEHDDLRREGVAQQEEAQATQEAETLEDLADEKRDEAAGHKGEKLRRQQGS